MEKINNLQKLGGVGALVGVATNLFALAIYATLLVPNGFGSDNLGQIVTFLANNQIFMHVFDIIIYLIFGMSLVFLSLGLYERLKVGSIVLAQAVTNFGLIYSVVVILAGTLSISNSSTIIKLYGENPVQAATIYLTLDSVATGLGAGGGETMISAVWIILLSWVALRASELPKALNYLGLAVGVAGIFSVLLPSLLPLAVVYGLGLIVWLAWLGIDMLCRSPVLKENL